MSSFTKKIFVRLRVYYNFYWKHKGDVISLMRARGAKIGTNCIARGGLSTFVNSEPYLIHMGNNVRLTEGVRLVTHDGGTRVFRDLNPDWKKGTVKMGTIEIGDNVVVGVGSIILQHVKIGSNVVIGAGTVVPKDIPSNVVVVGVPARILCSIEEYERRSMEQSITIPDEFLDNREAYLTQKFWDQTNDK